LEYLVQLSLRTTEAWIRSRPQVISPNPNAAPIGVWALPIKQQAAAAFDRNSKVPQPPLLSFMALLSADLAL
jgi:hypothetical protein